MTADRLTDDELKAWRARLERPGADEALGTVVLRLVAEVEEHRREDDCGTGLPAPSRLDLPCFVYGLFQPGELGFRRIEPFVTGRAHASVRGKLLVRDGLPLLKLTGDAGAPGSLLTFDASRSLEAYNIISSFEPAKHYKWQCGVLQSPSVEANFLVGAKPDTAGAEELEFGRWSASQDPVFTTGIAEVKRVIHEESVREGDPWSSLFRLQMAYLLLWSAIERYTALAYGPATGPNKRVKLLADDDLFKSALRAVVRVGVHQEHATTVFDSRNPEKKYKLEPGKPKHSADYFYQVRSNLSHRGKGAWNDKEKVRVALVTLLAVFEHMLKHSVFAGQRD
jgi:hypothetical protein